MATKVTNGLDLLNQRIISLADPSAATDAANKQYVDARVAGLAWKEAVRAASTATVDISQLNNGDALDGVTVATGDRVLLKSQSSGAENGIYVVGATAGSTARATDADSTAELHNATVFVREGTVNADTAWVQTATVTTVGTTAQTWTQFGAGGGSSYTFGDGLIESGGDVDIELGASSGLSLAGGTLQIDTSVVMRRFAANVGDGSATAITVTHNFNTRDVEVQVYTNATPWDTVLCDVTRPSVNTVTLTFATAPAAGAYRVVVVG